MARGVNKVTLIGNLGNDPEVKYTQGGTAICSISLATTSARKDRDGNVQERTEWHKVKLFGKLGEIAGEYLKRGRQVYIEGEIRYDKFTGRDGQERYVTEIIANEMQMLGGGGNERGGGDRNGPPTTLPNRGTTTYTPPASPAQEDGPFPEDDIPF